MHQLGIQNIQRNALSSSSSKLKFISICHELCLYVVAINVCTGTSIALFYCIVVRSEHI